MFDGFSDTLQRTILASEEAKARGVAGKAEPATVPPDDDSSLPF